jgi:glycosyltransferase involved in cell wall biosynthesis
VLRLTDSVLMVAYHFHPCGEISGALRTLAMARYLAQDGVQPIVLTPDARAYVRTSEPSMAMIPPGTHVLKAFALDARRHMGIGGRYPQWLAAPDRWVSWWPGAVMAGLRAIKRYRPRAIWSTFPIATSHLIAHELHRRTGVPWIADFRDPMIGEGVNPSGFAMRMRSKVEALAVRRAQACVFVTAGASELYSRRYAQVAHGDFEVIPNGFDEEIFSGLVGSNTAPKPESEPLVLVHSGMLYPEGRNPEPFFVALARILENGGLKAGGLRVVLRASGRKSAMYAEMVERYGLGNVVELAPPVGHDAALREQAQADALLLFQGTQFNQQVPAKVYEYLRVGRPILALTDPEGETARLVASTGAGLVAPIDDSEALVNSIPEFLDGISTGRFPPLQGEALQAFSRRAGATRLRELIERVALTE